MSTDALNANRLIRSYIGLSPHAFHPCIIYESEPDRLTCLTKFCRMEETEVCPFLTSLYKADSLSRELVGFSVEPAKAIAKWRGLYEHGRADLLSILDSIMLVRPEILQSTEQARNLLRAAFPDTYISLEVSGVVMFSP